MAAITFSIRNLDREAQRYRKIATELRANVQRAAREATLVVERDLKENGFTGRRPPRPNPSLNARGPLFWGGSQTPGALAVRRSGVVETRTTITSQVFAFQSGGRKQLLGVVGSPVRWLPIHERGGTITGKPWLAIPTVFEPRYGDRPGFWAETKMGNLMRFAVLGQRSARRAVPVVLLKRSVRLPARRMFATSVERVRDRVADIFGRAVALAVRV